MTSKSPRTARRILRRMALGRDLQTTIRRLILLALFSLLLFNYVALPVRVRGDSMEPTFKNGSWHLVNLLQFASRNPRRGEVVVISIAGRRALFLKRVLGLPGDSLNFFNGRLIINGREKPEPYLEQHGTWTFPPVTLKADEYFVAGDNRTLPLEAHVLGIVKREKILGGIFL